MTADQGAQSDAKGRRQRIAVIGGGIAGMSAAHGLAKHHAVTLFEAEPRLGGHARTVMAGRNGNLAVDTGFIIFNRLNYPRLSALFDELDIPVTEAEMSFSVSLDDGAFEYALKPKGALRGILAQPRNLCDPRFLGMLRDILRLNARAVDCARDPSQTLGDLLQTLGSGAWMRDRFLLPLTAAIWSVPPKVALTFPAQGLIRFLDNHALLSHKGHPQWNTVKGGATVYVDRLHTAIMARGGAVHLGAPVEAVLRKPFGVQVKVGGAWDCFDTVVMALHADQALALLGDPNPDEHATLSAIRFQPNHTVLHADTRAMPKRRAAWAAWNFAGTTGFDRRDVSVTYCMHKLQVSLPATDPLFVSLNPIQDIDPALVYDRVVFRHPVMDFQAAQARRSVAQRNGAQNTWFCGAWMANGFHEDGMASAAEVVSGVMDAPNLVSP